MTIAIIQGELFVRLAREKRWRRKYFLLDNEGYLNQMDRKGDARRVQIPITPNTQVGALKASGQDGGISLTGPTHEPLYLRAETGLVAEGWIRAFNIMKNGGSSTDMDRAERAKEETLRSAYAKKNAIGGTLERKKKGPKKTTLERKRQAAQEVLKSQGGSGILKSRPISFNPDTIPPPPGDFDDLPPPPEDVDAIEDSGDFDDGYIMRLGDADVFVDALGWEYYGSRESFLNGDKPLGSATLSLLV